MIDELKGWLVENFIDFKFDEAQEIVEISGAGKFFIFDSGEEPVFDQDFELNLSAIDTDSDELMDEGLGNTIYKFGDMWYYTSNDCEKAEMNPLQSVGKAFLEMEDDFTHLGVHGHRELLNGSGQYDEYAKKAKFFGYKALGICEKNTLAGTLIFQSSCKKHGIKPILGMSIDYIVDGEKVGAKVYAKNEIGWKNILNISNIINNENLVEKAIESKDLLGFGEGIVFVFDKDNIPTQDSLSSYKDAFNDTYYQIDTTEYSSDKIDGHYLLKTKEYIDRFGRKGLLKPILLSDSYYVHNSDNVVKKYLNMIDIGATHLQSKEQSFRPYEYHFDKFEPLFKDEDLGFFDKIFDEAVENTMKVAIQCDFEISMDFLNMPEYELTNEEKTKYKDKYELFDAIVDSNWNNRVPVGMDDEYQDRLDEEFRVIDGNGFLDYFLINWDWLEYCRRSNIYVGVARGSAGGSVLSYLLGVTHIDPIKYNLLFERFLNEGRLKKTVKTKYVVATLGDGREIRIKESKLIYIIRELDNGYENLFINAEDLREGDTIENEFVNKVEHIVDEVVTAGSPPDIDSDVESSGRQQVKEYLEERYGKNRVFSIGTFTSLGIKSAIGDVARMMGINTQVVKTVTKLVSQKEVNSGFGFSDFFAKAMESEIVKKFIFDYPELLEVVRVVMGNSKSPSIHAAGVVITPKYDKHGSLMNAWDWTPMKLHDDQMVSEWEGQWIEASGLLKLDLLGVTILDKIHTVVKSIKRETGEDVDFHDIYTNRLNDEKTYEIFQKGFTQNIFQFSGIKMTKFIQSMEPSCIDDIIAANALYRPATINLNYHEDYVEMKHGRKEVKYDWGMDEITKDTYGILVMQEQSMMAVQKIGGFSLQEADDVRKAMGKKKKDLMESYRTKFIDGAVKNGCDELDAIKIWNDIEQGAEYGFNRSHAAAYGLESYVTAYLKAHYPVHFYTMSLEFADDNTRPLIISEIYDDGRIEIASPNVNTSGKSFVTDYQNNKIYWALNSIKMVGDVATQNIVNIREADGEYSGIDDFIKRTKGHKVIKTAIINLILSGAFDEVEDLSSIVGRFQLIKKFYVDHLGESVPEDKFPTDQILKSFFWNRLQNSLSGLGSIDYRGVYSQSGLKDKFKSLAYLKPEDFNLDSKRDKFFGFAATLVDIRIMNSKKTNIEFAKLTLQCNDKVFTCMVWMEQWAELGDIIKKNKGSIIVLNGRLAEDEYSGGNQLYTHKKTAVKFF